MSYFWNWFYLRYTDFRYSVIVSINVLVWCFKSYCNLVLLLTIVCFSYMYSHQLLCSEYIKLMHCTYCSRLLHRKNLTILIVRKRKFRKREASDKWTASVDEPWQELISLTRAGLPLSHCSHLLHISKQSITPQLKL